MIINGLLQISLKKLHSSKGYFHTLQFTQFDNEAELNKENTGLLK